MEQYPQICSVSLIVDLTNWFEKITLWNLCQGLEDIWVIQKSPLHINLIHLFI